MNIPSWYAVCSERQKQAFKVIGLFSKPTWTQTFWLAHVILSLCIVLYIIGENGSLVV